MPHDAAGAIQPSATKMAPVEGAPKKATIRLIVAYTKGREPHTDIVKDMIDVAIAQTTSRPATAAWATCTSSSPTLMRPIISSGRHFEDVYRFRNKGDGYSMRSTTCVPSTAPTLPSLLVDDPSATDYRSHRPRSRRCLHRR